MFRPILFFLLLAGLFCNAQTFHVLHYTETSGYDHQTRAVSLSMFQTLATAHNFVVDDDQTGAAFNTLTDLQQYDVIVFSNTSGDAILDATQRANFEAYINNGGSYLGIHAASDTYRHSTANGSNTGTWDFYAELVGASVQESPNHVAGTPQYSMDHLMPHASTANLPNPWVKDEEYYYWENGYYGPDNQAVLQVEETVGPNNMVNSYDAPRPMSWYRELTGGGRMFYTALGHAASNYTTDQNFITHIRDALLWLTAPTVSAPEAASNHPFGLLVADGQVSVTGIAATELTLLNILGKEVLRMAYTDPVQLPELPTGLYLLEVSDGEKRYSTKLYVQ